MVGGEGGDSFTIKIPTGSQISVIHCRSSDRVYQIMLDYIHLDTRSKGSTDQQGGVGGPPYLFSLDKDECIVAVLLWAGSRVDAVQFKTNHGRSSPCYGGTGGTLYTRFAPAGEALVGFQGRSGSEIDSLEPIWGPTSLDTSSSVDIKREASKGEFGGTAWSDLMWFKDPRAAIIQSIAVRSEWSVDQIQVTYVGGQKCPGHGGDGGTLKTFNLNDGEYITAIEGRYGSEIYRLQFFTNTGRSSEPFGSSPGGSPFRWQAPDNYGLLYFDGRSGAHLDQLAPYWVPNAPRSYDIIDVEFGKIPGEPNRSYYSDSDLYYRNESEQVGHYTHDVAFTLTETTTFTLSESTTRRVNVSQKFSIQLPVISGITVDGDTEVGASKEKTVEATNGESKETKISIAQKIDIAVSRQSVMKAKLYSYSTPANALQWKGKLRITYSNGRREEFDAEGMVTGMIVQSTVHVDVHEEPIDRAMIMG